MPADDPKHLQGGTQDNGTFETTGSKVVWPQIMYGDGGQSGFNIGNSAFRFNSFTSNFHDVNFQNGDPVKWVIASGPIVASGESAHVLLANHFGSCQCRHNLPRFVECLADSGLGRQPGVP